MMVINLIGKWLDGSGWTSVIAEAGVTTSGVADSCLTSSHVKRSRYAHEVTIAALQYLKLEAFRQSLNFTRYK